MDIEVEVDLDDELIARLIEYTGITDLNELARRALLELIERAKRDSRKQD